MILDPVVPVLTPHQAATVEQYTALVSQLRSASPVEAVALTIKIAAVQVRLAFIYPGYVKCVAPVRV